MKTAEITTADIEALEIEIKDLETNPNVYEWHCSHCRRTSEPSNEKPTNCCARPDVDKVFVGLGSSDGDAWHAAGIMLKIAERAAPMLAELKQAKKELDAAALRDIRDEHELAKLRAEIDQLRIDLRDEQMAATRDASEQYRQGLVDGETRGGR